MIRSNTIVHALRSETFDRKIRNKRQVRKREYLSSECLEMCQQARFTNFYDQDSQPNLASRGSQITEQLCQHSYSHSVSKGPSSEVQIPAFCLLVCDPGLHRQHDNGAGDG